MLVRWCLTEEERERMGLLLPQEAPRQPEPASIVWADDDEPSFDLT
jgi:hypothetical protein